VGASPRASGVFVADTDGIVRRALRSAGVADADAEALLAHAMARAGASELPREAERLWELCADVLLPIAGERLGAHAADRVRARLEGALLALDAIQNGRGPGFTRGG